MRALRLPRLSKNSSSLLLITFPIRDLIEVQQCYFPSLAMSFLQASSLFERGRTRSLYPDAAAHDHYQLLPYFWQGNCLLRYKLKTRRLMLAQRSHSYVMSNKSIIKQTL